MVHLVTSPRRWTIAAVFVAFALAVCVDIPVTDWVYSTGLSATLKRHHILLLLTVRQLGSFPGFTLISAGIIFIMGPRWRPAAFFIALSGVLSGVSNFLKWFIGRRRPFNGGGLVERPFNGGGAFQLHPFAGGLHGLFGPNLSFPSGDVCLATATALSLAILFPSRRWICWCVIAIIGIERVIEGAHYPSDVVAGAALGWLCCEVSWRLLGKPRVPAPAANAPRPEIMASTPAEVQPPGVGKDAPAPAPALLAEGSS